MKLSKCKNDQHGKKLRKHEDGAKTKSRMEKRKQWFRGRRNKPKVPTRLEDLSEDDFNSDDDLSLNGEEFGPLSDTSSSDEGMSDGSNEGEDDSSKYNQEYPDLNGSISEDSTEDNDTEPEEKRKHDDVSMEREERTLFVGNLPNTVKKMKLKKWFTKYGKVECVRLRCAPLADPRIPKKVATIKKNFHEQRTNIHAFVRFETLEDARNAMAANGEMFAENYHLRVDTATGQKNFDDKKAVFVGNLPFDAEEDGLRDVFADCGDIESIRIVRDRQTCVGKGFAYVNFLGRHSVPLALEKNGEKLGKRELRVERANYKRRGNTVGQKEPKSKSFKRSIYTAKKSVKPKKKVNDVSNKSSFQGETGKRVVKKKSKKKNLLNAKRKKLIHILNNPSKKKKNK